MNIFIIMKWKVLVLSLVIWIEVNCKIYDVGLCGKQTNKKCGSIKNRQYIMPCPSEKQINIINKICK